MQLNMKAASGPNKLITLLKMNEKGRWILERLNLWQLAKHTKPLLTCSRLYRAAFNISGLSAGDFNVCARGTPPSDVLVFNGNQSTVLDPLSGVLVFNSNQSIALDPLSGVLVFNSNQSIVLKLTPVRSVHHDARCQKHLPPSGLTRF